MSHRLSLECLEALAAIGCSARPSPTLLTTYRVHVDATEDHPGVYIGEMTEPEIWSWLNTPVSLKESDAGGDRK